MEKHYTICYLLDEHCGNRLEKRIVDAEYFECHAKTLKDAIYTLLSAIPFRVEDLGYNIRDIFIGIRYVSDGDKIIDYNYKNRVIYKDELLRKYFYC